MSYTSFPQVKDVINGVSQDVRGQLSSLVGTTGQPILIDYTNRIHKQMLRFSRWNFLRSEPQYFLTAKGQSAYWVGPTGDGPGGSVDTGLDLSDVYQFKKDSVCDLSNDRELKWLDSKPIGPNLNNPTGGGRPGLPAVFNQNLNIPNVLFIFPPPNNENNNSPFPQVPIVETATGGALPVRTYLLKVTLVDSLGGESTSTSIGAPLYIPANNLAVVESPAVGYFGIIPDIFTSSGVEYNRYNVYAVQAVLSNGVPQNEGSETLQNTSGPISFGTNWTEPTSGLITTGVAVPTQNTLQPLGAYIIKFEYYKNRLKLTNPDQYLQIPDDYFDVIVNGVTYLAYKIMGKTQEAQMMYQQYKAGMTEMIADKNLFPEGVEFIRPDGGSYVNTQILGYLDPFFVSFLPVPNITLMIWGEVWDSWIERVRVAVQLIHLQLERKRHTVWDSIALSARKLSKKLFE